MLIFPLYIYQSQVKLWMNYIYGNQAAARCECSPNSHFWLIDRATKCTLSLVRKLLSTGKTSTSYFFLFLLESELGHQPSQSRGKEYGLRVHENVSSYKLQIPAHHFDMRFSLSHFSSVNLLIRSHVVVPSWYK